MSSIEIFNNQNLASGGKKVGRKRAESSDEDDSDYEKPQKKRKSGGGGGGYNAPVKLSADLADIVGGEEMPRHEVSQILASD